MKQNPTYDYCNTAKTVPINNRTQYYSNSVKSMGFVVNVLIATHKVFNSVMAFGSQTIKKASSRACTATITIAKEFRKVRLNITSLNKVIVVNMAINGANT